MSIVNILSDVVTRDVPIEQISLHDTLQPRCHINADVADEYAQVMLGGTELPPLKVVFDGTTHWLYDGYHRYHAYRGLGREQVACEIVHGSWTHAVVLSLGVNAEHGVQREPRDIRRAYHIGCAEKVFDPADSKSVREHLRCSLRWANELTQPAREEQKAARNATIHKLHEEGKTQRDIAGEVGMTQQGVSKALNNFGNSAQSCQTDDRPESRKPSSTDEEKDRALREEWFEIYLAFDAFSKLKPVEFFKANPRPRSVKVVKRVESNAIKWMREYMRWQDEEI